MERLAKFTFIVILIFTTRLAFGQTQPDSTKLFRVETVDGNEYLGLMISEDSLNIILDTKTLGKVNIPKTSIKKSTNVVPSSVKGGKLWFENTQSGRYFWAPDGYGLKKGEGYYQNIWVLWNQASYGVTNYFSIGAGIIPLFFFGGSPTPVFITPKFSIPVVKDKINMGVGAIAGTLLGEENTGFSLIYGLSTFGDRNANVTLGLGYGYAGGDWASRPVITLSGMGRVGAKTYLLTENYYFGSDEESVVLLSAGGRSIIKKAAIDYGLFLPVSGEMDVFIAIPWLGFTVPFGK